MIEKLKKNRNMLIASIIGAIVLVVAIIIVIVLVINNNDKEKEKEPEKVYSTEKTVEEEYGFTKQNAIDAVKDVFNSDNYKFDAEVREDNMYVVTVTNIEDNTKMVYLVDPNDGSFEDITETE